MNLIGIYLSWRCRKERGCGHTRTLTLHPVFPLPYSSLAFPCPPYLHFLFTQVWTKETRTHSTCTGTRRGNKSHSPFAPNATGWRAIMQSAKIPRKRSCMAVQHRWTACILRVEQGNNMTLVIKPTCLFTPFSAHALSFIFSFFPVPKPIFPLPRKSPSHPRQPPRKEKEKKS